MIEDQLNFTSETKQVEIPTAFQHADGSSYARGYPEGAAVRLQGLLDAVCPCHGVSIGRWDNRLTWRLDAKDEANADEIAAAQAILDVFDPWSESEGEQRVSADHEDDAGGEHSDGQADGFNHVELPAPMMHSSEEDQRAGLRNAITSHADSLLRLSLDDYERVIALNEIITGADSTPEAIADAINELKGHKNYANRARELIAVRDAKIAEVIALDARALPSYDVFSGWPSDGLNGDGGG